MEVESGLNALGIEPAESQANFCWFDLPDGADEAEVVKGLAERGVLVRAGAALGRAGRASCDVWHTQPERPFPRRAGRKSSKLAASMIRSTDSARTSFTSFARRYLAWRFI